ncbi:TonB-dependent receptor [Sphingopyxis sp. NJF-3]
MIEKDGRSARARELRSDGEDMMMVSILRHLVTTTALIGLAASPAALAQTMSAPAQADRDTPPDESRVYGDDIVVTATRQGEQSIQRVPMAITAISPEDLLRGGQGGLDDYTRGIPSVSLQSSGPGRNKIDIRGITSGTFDFTDAQDRPLVAVYIDEVPISLASSNPEVKVLDLERVEVLRGPQGTLFGAGSMSGTIRLITQKPDASGFFGSGEAGISVTEKGGGANYNLRGMVNVPLVTDKLAMRVTGYQGREGGFVDNLASGKTDANSNTNTQGRVAFRLTPSEAVSIDASALYMDLDAKALPTGYLGLGKFTTSIIGPEFYRDKLQVYNLTGNFDVGIGDIVASVSHVRRNNSTAIGGNQYLLAEFFFGEPIRANIFLKNNIREWDYEARFSTKGEGPLRLVTGLFYQNQKRDVWQNDPSDNFDDRFGALLGLPPGGFSSTDLGAFTPDADFSGLQNLREKQFAAFGELTWSITPRLDVTGGLRYFNWKQDFSLYFGGLFGVDGAGLPLTTQDRAREKGVNPRAVVSYRVNDKVMLFAEASKGFRYGGVNQPLPISLCGPELNSLGLSQGPVTFGADHLWSYSIGEKGRFFNNRLKLNATGFVIQWDDVQSKKLLPSCAYYFIQNKGSVQSRGLELETSLDVTSALTLGLSASYTDAKADGPIDNLGALDGDPAPYFPSYIATLTAQYRHPLGEGEMLLYGSWAFRDGVDTQFNRNLPQNRHIPASDYLTLSATYRTDNFEIGLFGQNLTNGTKILLRSPNSYPTFQPGDAVSWARPRTIGIRTRLEF